MGLATSLLDQLINGLTVGMVYVLLAAGLSVIFGVMDVINFAHGELFALGAYFAFAVVGTSLGAGTGFWAALVFAPLGVAVAGAAVERFTVRPLYGRDPLYHILLTFGLVLIFTDAIELVWGPQSLPFGPPPSLAGTVTVLGYTNSLYSYFVIAVGGLMALAAYLVLTETRFGLIVRAGSMDREMVRHLGIDIDSYYTLVFAFGSLLAAFGGIVLAGRQGVDPAMGNRVIIPAFVIVVLGGLGSFRGAVVGGLGVGIIQTLTRTYKPSLLGVTLDLEGLVVFLLMIGVLLVRPQGLFGNPEWHDPSGGGDLLTGAGSGVLEQRLRSGLGVALLAALLVAPLGIGLAYSSYEVNTLLVTAMIWALFALSLDFVMGYAGLVSLGHVLFYGLGAYTMALTVTRFVESMWIALVLAVIVGGVVAWGVGYLSIRVSGVYFSMITLGFAELAHQLTFTLSGITNGENGIYSGFDPTYWPLAAARVGELNWREVHAFYYVVVVLVAGSYLVARQLMRAPFGSVLQSIRESEQRATFVGYDTTAYKRRAFVVSGGLAGLAGGLAAVHLGGVSPEFLFWLKSGEVIVMTILGGMGTLYGPMLGAGVFVGLEEVLKNSALVGEQWQGVLGVVFVLFVIFVPRGLVALPARFEQLLSERAGGGGGTPAAAPDESAPEGGSD